jgi:Skp family chaperone for outer membrane proteins
MNKFILKLIKNEHPKWRLEKIITFYKFNFMFLLFSIIFIITTSINTPDLVFLPIVASIALAFTFVLMYINEHLISRIITCLVPPGIVVFFAAFITPSGYPPPAASYALALAGSITPFILFNYREIKYSLSLFLILSVSLLSFQGISTMCTNVNDLAYYEIYTKTFEAYVSFFAASLLIIVGLLFLNSNTKQFEEETEKLIHDIEEKKETLENNELELRKTLLEVEENKKAEEKRNWVTEGLAELSDIIRTTKDRAALYDSVINKLVRFGNANQGGLFIVREDEKVLEMVSCYAYERKKFVEKKIKFGEGLIGQCYLEKDIIYLTEVPENYVHITSGLGQSLPRCIFLIPMINNEEVEGIIEVAFFNPIEDYQKEFFKKAASIIASTVGTERIAEKTIRLLQQSQLQSNDLRTQEEEIRQNLEELQAMQEEVLRKEREYVDRIAHLEKEVENYKANTVK